MKKTTILLIALMVISVGFLSGCSETNNGVSDNLRIRVDNYTSYHIRVSIEIEGEDFSYNREVTIQRGESNTSNFNMQPKEQHVDITITATYVDSSDVSDVKTSSSTLTPTGEDWESHYRVYGSINETSSSISIHGPL